MINMVKSFFRSSFSENTRRRSYYFAYTILFGVTAFFCFSWFLFSGRSLIWRSDGWFQHFRALVYYSQYLREIVRHLLTEYRLIIPDWDFYIGEGSDIINAMHYYVIGDPIALLSIFVPTSFMQYFYSASCILRLYLAGISFSALCFGTGLRNRWGIMAGSLAYVFCNWALINAARHPYFLNPMIYFPLMILGIEKIIRKEKPYLFIIFTAVSAASNFYFFYMIVLLTVLYTCIRLCFCYHKEIQKGIRTLLQIGILSVVGVCISGVILLPVLMMFLHDSRIASASQPFHWLYPMTYYSRLPSMVISDPYDFWLCMGFAPSVVLAAFMLFIKKREDTFLKILFGVCIAIILFPIGGRILNGMSYMANRWSWAFALLCAYILAREWESLISLSAVQWRWLILFSIGYYSVCLLLEKSRSAASFAAIPLFFITLLILQTKKNDPSGKLQKQGMLLGLTVLGVFCMAFWKYSPGNGNYVSECKENSKVWEEWNNNEASAIGSILDNEYTRISGSSLTYNANIVNKISSTQYYWTISNPYTNRFRSSLAMREPLFSKFIGYDERTTPAALSSVEYYIVDSEDSSDVPYGYTFETQINANTTLAQKAEALMEELGGEELSAEQLEKLALTTENNYYIYRNDYYLPVGYCYDACLTKELWDSYNPVQKQEVQLEAAFTDAPLEGIDTVEPQVMDYLIPYDIECQGMEISQNGNSFITTTDNAKITLTLHQTPGNEEIYVGFAGLEFVPTPEYDLYFGDDSVDPMRLYNKTNWEMLLKDTQISLRKKKFYWDSVQDTDITVKMPGGNTKVISYLQPDSSFSSGRHNFIANLGYIEEPAASITISFSDRGIYTFDSLNVYGIPMDDFAAKIADLQENTLQNIRFGTDTVTGDISLVENKLLCLAIPFSIGWEAYIDNVQTEVHCLNERYPGIVVPAGVHTIRFSYHMPYKKEGFLLSLVGIAGFCFVLFLWEHRNRDSKTGRKKI